MPARVGVELRGGLVEDDEARAQREHGGEVHELLLAAGKRFGVGVQDGLDAEEMRDLRDAAAHFVLRHADALESEGELVPHCVAYDLGGGVLHDEADVGGGAARVHGGGRGGACGAAARQFISQHFDASALDASGCEFGFQTAQQRGFSAAGGAGDHAKRARGHVERDAVEHGFVLAPGIGEGEVADAHDGRCGRRGGAADFEVP